MNTSIPYRDETAVILQERINTLEKKGRELECLNEIYKDRIQVLGKEKKTSVAGKLFISIGLLICGAILFVGVASSCKPSISELQRRRNAEREAVAFITNLVPAGSRVRAACGFAFQNSDTRECRASVNGAMMEKRLLCSDGNALDNEGCRFIPE